MAVSVSEDKYLTETDSRKKKQEKNRKKNNLGTGNMVIMVIIRLTVSKLLPVSTLKVAALPDRRASVHWYYYSKITDLSLFLLHCSTSFHNLTLQ